MPTVTYTVFDGEILSENRAGTVRDYVPDPVGSTVALLDSTQAQSDTFSYWPYGEEKSRTRTTDTPYRSGGTSGYFRDSDSRSYVRARTVRKDHGRWLTQDPKRFAAGEVNLYRYCFASPLTWTDPSGLKVCFCQVMWGWYHTFISTDLCGNFGSAGPPVGRGRVREDNDYIEPYPEKPGERKKWRTCVPRQGENVRCKEVFMSGDPGYEAAVCKCKTIIKPYYILLPLPVAHCGTWAISILECARRMALGPPITGPSFPGDWPGPIYGVPGITN